MCKICDRLQKRNDYVVLGENDWIDPDGDVVNLCLQIYRKRDACYISADDIVEVERRIYFCPFCGKKLD